MSFSCRFEYPIGHKKVTHSGEKTPVSRSSRAKRPLLATLFSLSMMAHAHGAGNHMQTGGITSQPIGHLYFCQDNPDQCKARNKKSKRPPKLTRKRWSQLVRINSVANRSVEPVTDQDLYGVEEHWTYPQNYGDCEDYVLLKQHMLIQSGWPESSLLITVVKQPNGDGHAVLTVRTSRGDFILDNLDEKIRPWEETNYKFLKRQSSKHSGRWITIRDDRSSVAQY